MAQSSTVIRSLVVPLDRELMLLPGSVVAEVVPYKEPEPAPEGAPAWLVGMVSWREQRVPLLSIEAFISGNAAPAPSSSARIAILKTLDTSRGFPFYGLLTRQIPRLVSVQPDVVEPAVAGDTPRHGIAADLLFNGEPIMIPDVDALEAGLSAVLPT